MIPVRPPAPPVPGAGDVGPGPRPRPARATTLFYVRAHRDPNGERSPAAGQLLAIKVGQGQHRKVQKGWKDLQASTTIGPMVDARGTRLTALLVLSLVSGCTAFAPTVRPDEKRDPSSAYLYGRFYVDAERRYASFAGHQSIGFAIKCRNGATYTIGFSNHTPLQMIKVAPSKCQLDEIVYTDADGRVIARTMATFRLLRNEILEPGGVYYIGDFVAGARTDVRVKVIYTEFRMAWAIGKISDNYAETTREMKETFPKLASVTTEDRMSR